MTGGLDLSRLFSCPILQEVPVLSFLSGQSVVAPWDIGDPHGHHHGGDDDRPCSCLMTPALQQCPWSQCPITDWVEVKACFCELGGAGWKGGFLLLPL